MKREGRRGLGQGEVEITAKDTWKRIISSFVHQLLAHPAKKATTTTTCLPMAWWLAASLKSGSAVERRGCGRWPRGTTRTAHPHTAMRRRARLRWRLLQRAGDGNRAAAETAYSSMAAAGSSSSTNRAHSWAISIKVARETPPGNIFASCKHARAS